MPKRKEIELQEMYGEKVFSLKAMARFLTETTFLALKATIEHGEPISAEVADEVAEAMRKWALSKGATHYTHWFQPLTGLTAEKHEAFVFPDFAGGSVLKLSGKELIKGEPDASSFPSGGARATYEARGYTAWDPTSPAFIKYSDSGPTLCIPTAFCSYKGEALDKKTPLLRSIAALDKAIKRILKLFDGKDYKKKSIATLGPEQEYFLIDKKFFLLRPDLVATGRTLFGRRPPKHQQMEDHYFGSVKSRIIAFMEEVDRECWRLGIPAHTRHNEVAPAQFELAPVFEELNVAIDHNMMIMQVLKEVADRHGLVCLLHEKPFAGVNGSGKHNNWSIADPEGRNLLEPGNNPHENAKFLTFLFAIIKAVDTHAKLLRVSVAHANNDHRLGANEAPPAIISIFLGDQLMDIIEQIERNGGAKSSKSNEMLKLGVSSLPEFPKDVTDRNRTSPFAFTGNKFEFRAVGSSQSCSTPNMVLNTIVAEALDEISEKLEKAVASGEKFNEALQKILKEIIIKHKRVLFNGDNYSKEWEKEAQSRGLPNIKTTGEALSAWALPETAALFQKYGVLSKDEVELRFHVYTELYEKTLDYEGHCALDIAKTMIFPACVKQQKLIADSLEELEDCGVKKSTLECLHAKLELLSQKVSELCACSEELEKALESGSTEKIRSSMESLRAAVDFLEGEVQDSLWPLPKYRDMLFVH